jgi:hypothetical protein
MSARRYIPLLVTSGAIVLGGYGIMLFVTPTDDQVKAVSHSLFPLVTSTDELANDS